MADITMPKMGFDMTEGTLVRWLKKVGDEIKKGDAIAEIETDKVTIEIEAFASGKLTEIVAAEGAVVPVGGTIAKLGGDGAAAEAPAPNASAAPAPSAAPAVMPAQNPLAAAESGDANAQGVATPATSAPATPTPSNTPASGPAVASTPSAPSTASTQRIIASPVAKRLATEQNLPLQEIQGSGPGGRIVRKDVEAYVAQPRAAAPAPAPTPAAPVTAPAPAAAAPAPVAKPGTRREPLSRLRQTIARRLVQSKGPVPHFYVTSEIDMSALVDLRKQVNATAETKITVNDFIVKAVAQTLKQFPVLNASFAEDALEYHDSINISIAVATDNGLLAPAVTDVDKKSLGTVSAEAKELIERTRNGKATPDELGRGTFSVSNLGMYPVDSFVAIINPPQAAILAVGAATEVPVVRNGQIVIGNVMKATISVDHRVSDGAVAAQFLQALKRILENPMLILI